MQPVQEGENGLLTQESLGDMLAELKDDIVTLVQDHQEATRMEAQRALLCLDADEGYAIQLSIWPNKELEPRTWISEFMLQSADLTPERAPRTLKKLARFLGQYQRAPLGHGVQKPKRKTEAPALSEEDVARTLAAQPVFQCCDEATHAPMEGKEEVHVIQ